MFIDGRLLCGGILGEVSEISSLLFLLATSTHERTPCRRICFSVVFSILFEFFRKEGQNGEQGYSLKGVDFLKTIKGSVK